MVTAAQMRELKRANGGAVRRAPGGPVSFDDLPSEQPGAVSFDDIPAAPAPKGPPISQGQAFLTGAEQGLTGNFADEIRGARAASGVPESVGRIVRGVPVFGQIVEPAMGLGRYLGGDEGAGQRYEEARDQFRERTKAAREQHPWTSIGGEAAGAIALPAGALLKGASMAARMASGAATGAGYGAVSGAGEGETLPDRAARAGIGAGIGTVAGAAAPVVMKGAEAAGSGISNIASGIVAPFRGSRDPEKEAAKRIIDAATKHFEERGAPLNPEQINALADVGNPQAILDLLGERGYAIARSAANVSPEARDTLGQFINPRFESQSARAVDFVRSMVKTPADAGQTREALAAISPARAPFYQKAYRDGADGIWDDELYAISNASMMRPIMKDAALSLEGKTVTGRASHPISESGTPTLEFWDQVKRTLDSKINMAKRAGDRETAGDLDAIRRRILEKTDEATIDPATGVSSYATARGVAHEIFKASDALEAGEKFVTGKFKGSDVRAAIAKMNDEEKTLFAEGYASELVRRLEGSGDRRSILNHVNTSPAARERMELALGKPQAERFKTYLEVEGLMDRARTAMGNSTTARQLVEMGLAGGAAGVTMGDLSLQNIMTGAILWKVARSGATGFQNRVTSKATRDVAENVARMLVSNDPAVLRKGVEAVHRNKNFRDSLRAFDDHIARVGTQQSQRLTTGSAPARAEDKDQ